MDCSSDWKTFPRTISPWDTTSVTSGMKTDCEEGGTVDIVVTQWELHEIQKNPETWK